jgi:hypothetical protein
MNQSLYITYLSVIYLEAENMRMYNGMISEAWVYSRCLEILSLCVSGYG